MEWRKCVKYARCVPQETQEMLDILESLIPMEEGISKYSTMAAFLDKGKELGLLTGAEVLNIRSTVGPNM